MLQLETVDGAYAFHSYETNSAKLIKPDHSIHSNNPVEMALLEISSTTLIYKDQLVKDSLPATFKQFDIDCIEQMRRFEADIYLIGTGNRPLFPDKTVMKYLAEHKLSFDFMDMGAACRTFNILSSEYRNVAALIFFN